jgi:hypothetical protein
VARLAPKGIEAITGSPVSNGLGRRGVRPSTIRDATPSLSASSACHWARNVAGQRTSRWRFFAVSS